MNQKEGNQEYLMKSTTDYHTLKTSLFVDIMIISLCSYRVLLCIIRAPSEKHGLDLGG